MENRLSEAATKGSVESLLELLQDDPLILDKTVVSCVSETPLHTASVLRHLDFVNEILSRKPELASELDSDGCSPLHLAVAKGYLKIVRELLSIDPEMSVVRNLDGRTPLHVAAIKGRIEVLTELVRFHPESTRVLTDRGETGLHLCVRHGKLECLTFLLEATRKMDCEFVNVKDCDGNTILHIAVAMKQRIEIIKFLLTTGAVEVNALNRNGSTALDILMESPREARDLEIEDSLCGAGALSAKDLHLIVNDLVPTKNRPITKPLSSQQSNSSLKKHKETDWLGQKRSTLMVVASLIATVAFQSGLTPPGGVWQDDYQTDSNGNQVKNAHVVGKSVMAYQEPIVYGHFMIFNTIAFLASLSTILLLVSGLPMKRRRWMWIQMVIMWIAITALVLTYFISLRRMSPDDINVRGTLREVTAVSVLTWLTLMGVVFIGNAVRMNLWILRKYGCIKKKKERRPLAAIDDDDDGPR